MSATLADSFGRHIEHLHRSVTDSCNRRCFCCLPRRARGFANRKNLPGVDGYDTGRSP